MQQIAALYVQTGGSYFNLEGVTPWDQEGDARMYMGPHPVVAHPPCQRWGKLWAGQPLWIKRTGERKKKGDDEGCFKSALFDVRTFGGVIEHPWGSHAWAHFSAPLLFDSSGLNRLLQDSGINRLLGTKVQFRTAYIYLAMSALLVLMISVSIELILRTVGRLIWDDEAFPHPPMPLTMTSE